MPCRPAHAGRARPPALARMPCVLLDAGRSSDSQARTGCCLLATARHPASRDAQAGGNGFSSAGPCPLARGRRGAAWSQRRGRPGIAPEFPVCPPHENRVDGPPESEGECNGRAARVNLRGPRRRDPQGRDRGGCGVANLDGGAGAPVQSVTVARPRAAHRARAVRAAVFAPPAPQVLWRKILRRGSSQFPPSADSPFVPRGITVPVGQPGGGNNLQFLESRNGSTGLPQDSSWITTSGRPCLAIGTKTLT